MSELKPCPCGRPLDELHVTEKLSGKWIEVVGDCCGEWTLEIRNNYATGDDMAENARRGWNDAVREETQSRNAVLDEVLQKVLNLPARTYDRRVFMQIIDGLRE